ncbi:M48 family metallopeptidase [candidate division WOR-3 bacterium]|nr:M48 family metallopeptidase [candidate division WOR-3 bacterium]
MIEGIKVRKKNPFLIKKIVIKRSATRKKTIQAKLKDEVMEILAPLNVSEKKLNEVIKSFKHRFEKREKEKFFNRESKLPLRVQKLNQKYFGGELKFKYIKYSANQSNSFGICYPHRRTILINGYLKKMPQWVEDYVIVHELAHLVYPNHSKDFWKLVRQYPKTERAIGYLMAKGIEEP